MKEQMNWIRRIYSWLLSRIGTRGIDIGAIIAARPIVWNKVIATMQKDYMPKPGSNIPPPTDPDDLLRKMDTENPRTPDDWFLEMISNVVYTPPRLCFAGFLVQRFDLWIPILSSAVVGTTTSKTFLEESPRQFFYSSWRPDLRHSVPGNIPGLRVKEYNISCMHRVLAYAMTLSDDAPSVVSHIAQCRDLNKELYPYIERTLLKIIEYVEQDN